MKLFYAAVLIAFAVQGEEKKVKLEDLPAAVQASVKEHTKGATLVGLSTEKEKGKTVYEVETRVNGKGRDFDLDQSGAVLETEDEVDLDSIPAAAKAAIRKRAADGTVLKVERVTAGSSVSYEAVMKSRAGKRSEYAVNPDGTPHKED